MFCFLTERLSNPSTQPLRENKIIDSNGKCELCKSLTERCNIIRFEIITFVSWKQFHTYPQITETKNIENENRKNYNNYGYNIHKFIFCVFSFRNLRIDVKLFPRYKGYNFKSDDVTSLG